MTDHDCTWMSGTIVWIDGESKIKTNCNICGKELIKEFDIRNHHYRATEEEHKKRMKEYAKHKRPL